MISVMIGETARRLEEVDPYWINQQINGRHRDGQLVCVQVSIDEPAAKMTLATPTCAPNGGGGRRPNRIEQELFDLWRKHRLDSTEFTGGELVAFLRQLERML